MSSLKGQLANVEGSVKSMKMAVVVGSVLTVACLAAVFCVTILGPNEDLSVWIPKKEDADTSAGQRPLQLPATLRRHFGSALMSVVGPDIEPNRRR